jgi:hypothetical protein
VLPDRGPDGLGRARTFPWPESVVEHTPEQLRADDIDLVVLQRPHEIDLVERWTGRRPGRDLPALFLEHNAPEPHPVRSVHPLAERDDLAGRIPLVHVTHFNATFWDNGGLPVSVIEHGVVDPGERYTGELPHAAVVINEPDRRGRMVGADLLPRFAAEVPVDLFGMSTPDRTETVIPNVTRHGDVPQAAMHGELARRRVYLHTTRWTSLGLALIEAMHLGMPVVALAATEVVEAVPPTAGVVSTDVRRLVDAAREFAGDAEAARLAGKAARAYALERYGLSRFLSDWDRVIEEVLR